MIHLRDDRHWSLKSTGPFLSWRHDDGATMAASMKRSCANFGRHIGAGHDRIIEEFAESFPPAFPDGRPSRRDNTASRL